MTKKTTGLLFEIVALTALIFGAVYMVIDTEPRTVKVNCDVAEISPDYSTNIKEMCRKLRR